MQADRTPRDQLAAHRVFGLLPPDTLALLAERSRRLRCGAGSIVVNPDQTLVDLMLIEDGTVGLSDADAGWTLQLRSGECFGAGLSPMHQPAGWQARAETDSRLLLLPADDLAGICRTCPWLAQFFPLLAARGILREEQQAPAASGRSGPDGTLSLLSTPVRSLIKRDPITVAPTEPIRAAAALMREQRVSSVLLVEQGHLFGLVTDRDLRNRVIAQGLSSDRPVADIATLAPITLDAGATAFEAMLLMARQNIHHLPLMEGQRIAGLITATDLTEQQSLSAVYLVGDVYKQDTVDGLAPISGRVRLLQQQLASADASAYATGHIVTAITDALTVRLIHLAEARLGPAPIDYVWVAAGSQGRNEQTARSDQDNCLILDDAFDEPAHGDYFRAFATFVCDGLDACGYVYCPGEMMAMTDTWRQPRRVWMRYFSQWINTPEPTALMLTSVFFDQRAIHGKASLLDSLRRDVLRLTRGNTLFLAHMVGNALSRRPPLGLFGQIAPIRSGEHAGTVDLKHGGTGPVVELARIFALAGAIDAVNTNDRLELAAQSGEVGEQGARDLRDAFEFIGKLRIAHQARQTGSGRPADNFLLLAELSNFERSHLKAAFSMVNGLQDLLGQRYLAGRF